MALNDEFVPTGGDDEPEKSNDLVARTAGGLGGAALGLLGAMLFGPPGALIGSAASPLLTDGAKGLGRVLRRRLERTQQAIDAATEFSGRNFDDLVEVASDDDRRLEIIGQALQGAALSKDGATIRALGRALAQGVLADDDARVDESLRIVSTLAALDPIDVKVLDRMCEPGSSWFIRGTSNNLNRRSVTGEIPEAEPVVDHVIARLSQLGLVTRPDSGGLAWDGVPWIATDFGHLCVDTLHAAGAVEDV